MNIENLMSQSWTWTGPTEVQDPDGTFFELRVAELPDFFVACRTREEVEAEAAEALRAFLQSYLDRDELPPIPGQWQILHVEVGPAVDYPTEAGRSINYGKPWSFPELEAATA